MKKTAFILAVLFVVGIVMAQNKVEVAKITAPPTGLKTAANSDSVVCASDTGCVVYQATASNLNATVVNAAGTAYIGGVRTWADGTLASGFTAAAMTGTTSTQVIAATASNYIYVTQCTVSNGSTTVSTDVILQDGSGGTTIYRLPAPAASVTTTGGGGGTFTFPVPLKVPTAGNALFVANITTGSSVWVSCSGYKSTTTF